MSTPVAQKVQAILLRYLAPVIAESVFTSALRETAHQADRLGHNDLPVLLRAIERRVRLFVPVARQEQALQDLRALIVTRVSATRVVEVTVEVDVSVARVRAKALCEAFGARSLVTQKFATITSELARNIVSYTSGGRIELSTVLEGRSRVEIAAIDRGTGIPNLEEVMSGLYRSKTGLGLGILGVKRLADSFKITTGSTGTHISAGVFL